MLWLLRILAGLIALASASLLLSSINYSNDYFSHIGGATGILLEAKLALYFAKEVTQITAAFILFFSLYFCLALNGSTWLVIGKYIAQAIAYFVNQFFFRYNHCNS